MPLLPRREDPDDRRGHRRGPADGDRAGARRVSASAGASSPSSARIREVGPRDGFQNEPEIVPTEVKVALINALARTGLQRLEVTSFVRADVIPQLADAAEVLERIDIPAGGQPLAC